jgi:acetolactate synthase-1/2/3 large subunit
MGAAGYRITTADEIEDTFNDALNENSKPVLIEFVVDPDDMVFPMVPAGGNNNNVILNQESIEKKL